MFDPSLSLMPSACVLLTPSEPAKSTRLSYEIFIDPSIVLLDWMFILKTVCERDEVSFNLVSAIFRSSSPCSISFKTSAAQVTSLSERRLM